MRAAGWALAGVAFCALLFAAVGGGLPLTDLFAVGRDVVPRGVPAGVVPGLSALDLFQLALALFVGLAFRRFLA